MMNVSSCSYTATFTSQTLAVTREKSNGSTEKRETPDHTFHGTLPGLFKPNSKKKQNNGDVDVERH